MKPAARLLLEKLLRTRPRPSEKALTELFMAIKSKSIDELLSLCRGGTAPTSTTPLALEAEVKKRLRSVRGKAADFVPYLVHAISTRIGTGRPLAAKGVTLSKALAMATQLLGTESASAIDDALKAFVAANDVTYRLKSA